MRSFGITAWLIAMLLSSGCSSDGTTDEESLLLDVDNLWQGSVPVEYDILGFSCRADGITNLLIPYSISANSPLQIELYGCWLSSDLIECNSDGKFEEAQVSTDGNKVSLSLRKGDWPEENCPSIAPEFRKYHTFEINGAWQPGELEIVIQNSGVDLTGYVTVE